MAAHSSILPWEIPWAEEPARLQSMGLRRVGHNWATNKKFFKLGYVDLLVSFLYHWFNLLAYSAFSFSSLFTVLVLLYIYIKFLNSLSSICVFFYKNYLIDFYSMFISFIHQSDKYLSYIFVNFVFYLQFNTFLALT